MASLASPFLCAPSCIPSARLRPLLCHSSLAKPRSPEDSCSSSSSKPLLDRRHLLTLAFGFPAASLLLSGPAVGLLEGDDDEQLLEKVKEDRKKKIQKRGELNAYKEETACVQTAVYQLSKAGQALDRNDFLGASSALGRGMDVGWIAKLKTAFSKVSSSKEEQTEADSFSSALASLQSAVFEEDIDLSKSAFVASADALEKWSYLTGFAEQLKGL